MAGGAVVACCRDVGDEAGAAPFDLPISGWRKLRDEILLGKARELETKAATCLSRRNRENRSNH